MSLELFNSLATFGTFVVVAATAIAALAQLRHARSANLIEGLSEAQRSFESPEFRYQVVTRGARTPENQDQIAKIIRVATPTKSWASS